MKKLFDKVGKKRETNTLVGKVVLVGQYSVKVEEVIGEGGFATIYRCTDVRSGQTFALKHMRLGADADAIKEVQQEAKTMARLKGHFSILQLHAVAFAGPSGAETDGFMLLDYCSQTLLEVMQRNNFNLDDFLVYEIFQDVVWAVEHMHKCNPPLAHRDIKAENVLKNSKGRWVICDFGSSTARAQVYDTPAEIAMEEDNIRRTTTPAYRSPEMWDLYSRQRIDTAVDIWALGVLLYVLAFGKLPFPGDSKLSILYGKYEMPPGRPVAMRSLIQDMLQVNPKDRPDVLQIISKLDALRYVLSGDPSDALPPSPSPSLPPPPPPQQLQQGTTASPHPHSHCYTSGPGPTIATANQLPYPVVALQGVQPGQSPRLQLGPLAGGLLATQFQQQQQQRVLPPTANGTATWPNGPIAPYSPAHVPGHIQPEPQPQPHPSTSTSGQLYVHAQQPQPQLQESPHLSPHPCPYPLSPQLGPPSQLHMQQHLPPGQPYASGNSAAPHPGVGQGPVSTAAVVTPVPPRSMSGSSPAQQVLTRQGNFNPSWPISQQQQQQQLPQQQRAVQHTPVAAPAVRQLDLMDAAMQEPTLSAVTATAAVETSPPIAAAAGVEAVVAGPGADAAADWERDLHLGTRVGPVTPTRSQREMANDAGLPSSAVSPRPKVVLSHRRTGSHPSATRLPDPSTASVNGVADETPAAGTGPGPGAGGATSHVTMGFGDDSADWGEQPAFGSETLGQRHPQHHWPTPSQEHQIPRFASQQMLPTDSVSALDTARASSATASWAGGDGGHDVAVAHVLLPGQQAAGVTHSTANNGTPTPSTCPPLTGAVWTMPSTASSAAPPQSPPGYGGPSDGCTAFRQLASVPNADGSAAGAVVQRVGSFELVSGGLADTESLRAQLQQLTAANMQLEARVRQLEGVVASQGAIMQQLAVDMRAVVHHHHQQQLHLSQQQPRGSSAVQRQEAVLSENGAGCSLAAAMSRSASLGFPMMDHDGVAGSGRVRAAAAGDGRVRGAPSCTVAPLELVSEPWGLSAAQGEQQAPSGAQTGGAVYPALRYEDLT